AAAGRPDPRAAFSAPTFVELIGGALLILGALTPLVGVLLAANVIGALVIVHLTPVPFVDQGGWELVAALAAGALLIAAAGPGRFSIDRLLFGRRSSLSPTRAADPRDELRAPPGHAQEPALRDAASSEG